MLALAETRPRRPIPPLLPSVPVLSHTTTTLPNRICATGAVGNPIIFGIEWDAENRLLAVNSGTHRSEFTYDGESRRVRIVEKDNGSTTSDRRYIWCGGAICEQRDGTGATVQRRFFEQGFLEGTNKYFYAKDHLGSIRETTDNAGTIQVRMEYDPYGRPGAAIGNPTWGTFGYTGHLHHWDSGVIFAPYRGYLSAYGRWISEDLVRDGPNPYSYVSNNALRFADPSGLLKLQLTWEIGDLWPVGRTVPGPLDIQPECTKRGCDGKWKLEFTVTLNAVIHPSAACPQWSAAHEMEHVLRLFAAVITSLPPLHMAEAQSYSSKADCLAAATRATVAAGMIFMSVGPGFKGHSRPYWPCRW